MQSPNFKTVCQSKDGKKKSLEVGRKKKIHPVKANKTRRASYICDIPEFTKVNAKALSRMQFGCVCRVAVVSLY